MSQAMVQHLILQEKNVANPIKRNSQGKRMMLRYSLDLDKEADVIEARVAPCFKGRLQNN